MRKTLASIHYTAEDLRAEDFAEGERLRPTGRLENCELVVWDRIAPILNRHGYLNDLFIDSLVEYCRTVVELDCLNKFLRGKGNTYKSTTRNGTQFKAHPEVGMRNEAKRMLRSYVGDFGLTPQARKQLESAIQMDLFGEDENPFEQLEETAGAAGRTSH